MNYTQAETRVAHGTPLGSQKSEPPRSLRSWASPPSAQCPLPRPSVGTLQSLVLFFNNSRTNACSINDFSVCSRGFRGAQAGPRRTRTARQAPSPAWEDAAGTESTAWAAGAGPSRRPLAAPRGRCGLCARVAPLAASSEPRGRRRDSSVLPTPTSAGTRRRGRGGWAAGPACAAREPGGKEARRG